MRKFIRTSAVAAAAAAAVAIGAGVAGATPAERVQNGQYTFHVYSLPLQPPVASVPASVADGQLVSNGIVLPFEVVPALESDGTTVIPEVAFVELNGSPVGFLER
ncbi:hypothetical protein [Gordonia sp. p3-SID1431]|jgi:hypothetical protein|uniref:hypothetical protein n=1 Tax=Gordonia sp. p3-SID1431 TaxID=2916159 RepID=UPI0021A32DF9|nr:hypothetical protein [Gordonia sp. p3-SID1431]MCT1356295.1 hypothetical protein [Gordonia sp. p3-SID1431]